MSELTTAQKADALVSYVRGPNVKGKIESLISKYEEVKHDLGGLLEVKDELNQLSFFLGELQGKAKDTMGRAEIEANNAFNKEYLKQRSEVGESGRLKSVDDSKYNARLISSEALIVGLQADVAATDIRNYLFTCKSYRDSCVQRIPILKEEMFSSRQQV
jgi:hypothetical protein